MSPTSFMRPARIGAMLALLGAAGAGPAAAQQPSAADTVPRLPVRAPTYHRVHVPHTGLVTVGSIADDRRRVDELLGRVAPAPGGLLRSASTLTPPLDSASGTRAELIVPEVRVVYNSDIVYSLNEGNLWAGRGRGMQLLGGARVARGRVRAILAPVLVYQQNEKADYYPSPTSMRDRYAFPWRSAPSGNPFSIDLPSRFGESPRWRPGLGESSVTVMAGPLAVGAANETQWWGPGVRNALVLSNNAPGIPHLFLRTERPLRTRLGNVEGRWLVGALAESPYFDTLAANDTRSLSAVALAFQPAFDSGLSLGVMRAVYRGVDGPGSVPLRALDAWISRVGAPGLYHIGDRAINRGPDQVIAVFGRWRVPQAGLEAYAEYARRDIPSLRELLRSPHQGRGYTVGLQWAREVGSAGSALRLQGEATTVEASAANRQQFYAPWYLSRTVPQGYTHEGRVLGAAIGPGSSSQWLGGDWMARRWQAGLFAGRIRWQEDFHPYARENPSALGNDVTVLGGARGALRTSEGDLWVEYTGATRFNQFFQYRSTSLQDHNGLDRRNHTLRFGWSARPRAGR